MNSEKDSDPEFAKLYDAMNIEAHPDLIIWMSGMDNKASVVKEMASNPTKFTNILMLARSGSTGLAKMELEKISASIKANQEAQKNAKSIDSPLSQLKPSNISSDNGDMSVSDYRLMFKG
jgi:ABC-type hemin transport system substrate-binding protein